MNVNLMAMTNDPVNTVLTAAMLCYRNDDILEIGRKAKAMTDEEVMAFFRRLVRSGHLSPFEHASFTFGVEGISRVTSHQLVRHRIASYSQRSQRYCDMVDANAYCPDVIMNVGGAFEVFEDATAEARVAYNKLISLGVSKEYARYVLPEATETALVVTMNARELRHFFELRCDNSAQAEIRELATTMRGLCMVEAYALFSGDYGDV